MRVKDDASVQEMFSIYCQTQSQVPVIVEFEHLLDKVEEKDRHVNGMVILVKMRRNLKFPFEEAAFMRSFNIDALNAPEYSEFVNPVPVVVPNGELAIGMKFNSRKKVIKAINEYNLCRGIDYRRIKPLVEVDPSIKVRSVIADVQSKFNYTMSYRKTWMAMIQKEALAAVEIETTDAYRGNELAQDVRILQ
ncbi:hypothetical protein PIB30_061396 [Stylosanthes scabra]|uniref:Uncharacterized protein n=1 Tax=Stylosanthes scabra TaxID=79078 RepID=A0ABU6RL51_9FABA|nr:hypothetical protein [Stylosanthes scabra]